MWLRQVGGVLPDMCDGYNAFDAMKDLVVGDLEVADKETVATRIGICNTCEMCNSTLDLCTICGCYIPAKVRLAKATCPIENW